MRREFFGGHQHCDTCGHSYQGAHMCEGADCYLCKKAHCFDRCPLCFEIVCEAHLVHDSYLGMDICAKCDADFSNKALEPIEQAAKCTCDDCERESKHLEQIRKAFERARNKKDVLDAY